MSAAFPHKSERPRLIVEYSKRGLGMKAIGRMLGITHIAVRYHRLKLGVATRSGDYKQAMLRKRRGGDFQDKQSLLAQFDELNHWGNHPLCHNLPKITATEGGRTCSNCNEEKPIAEFYADKADPLGRSRICKPCSKRKVKAWGHANPEKLKAKSKGAVMRWRRNNPQKWKAYLNRPDIKIGLALRSRIKAFIAGKATNGKLEEMVGCTREHLVKHIENQFVGRMSWENQGRCWHIDHIVPVSRFNLLDSEQRAKASHWTNLQPLWAKENLSKGDKLINAQLGLPLTIT